MVGLLDLLEALLGQFLELPAEMGDFVGMVLAGQFAISSLDLLRSGVGRYLEDFIRRA